MVVDLFLDPCPIIRLILFRLMVETAVLRPGMVSQRPWAGMFAVQYPHHDCHIGIGIQVLVQIFNIVADVPLRWIPGLQICFKELDDC